MGEDEGGAGDTVYLKLEAKAYDLKMLSLLADGVSRVAAGRGQGR
jgi:hypothetical protein